MYATLADLVLLLHAAIVLFVVGGLIFVVAGNAAGWRWVNTLWFRLLHLVAIAIVVAQAWIGVTCPLTSLESWLRLQAGGERYTASFIEHWLRQLLFFELPAWVFTLAYTLFALLVVACWWRFPPVFRRPRQARTAVDESRDFDETRSERGAPQPAAVKPPIKHPTNRGLPDGR